MGEKKDVNIDSTNIFDEFGADEKLKKEIKGIEEEKNKDASYYIGVTSNFFTFINMIVLLSFMLFGAYIYVQNDDTMNDVSYLTPICDILVDNKGNNSECSSVSALTLDYEKNNKILVRKYYEENLPLIESIYKNLSFIDSKEVSFLINKTKNKLHVLKVLSEFDKMKNDFSPLNKTRINCRDLIIKSSNEITMECSAYSGVWDGKILGFSGENKGLDKVHGTSISVASSFINFIEKYDNSNFLILDKPKKFNFIEIVDDNGYTRKTDFKLKLKYNNISSQNK